MKKSIVVFLALFLITMTTVTGQIINGKAETICLIKTSMGDIKVKLYNDTPLHRDNFIKMIKSGWYDGSNFHRVINAFMIQGGWNKAGVEDPGHTVPAEINDDHFHFKGALAGARMPDNVNPDKESSGSQFYIVQGKVFTDEELDAVQKRSGHTFTAAQREVYKTIGGTPHLDGSYTVFGEVIEGLDVVDKIAAVATGAGNKPTTPITFSITILE
jgi:cyclophilin family peptidyl-prolyl cis-trans isomerase